MARGVRYLCMVAVAVVTVFPFYAMLVLSLRSPGAIELPRALVPWPLTLDNYSTVLAEGRALRWALNTAVYALVSVVFVLLFASMAGYAFAKKRFPGREPLFWSFVAMLMIPHHITFIPAFLMVAQADAVNTYWGLIVPTLANAQAVFLMRQFIIGLPDELIDAAKMDGASEWRVYWSVILPLTRPVLATLAVFVFLWHWNDFLWPLVVSQADDMRTLTVGISALLLEDAPIAVQMAGACVAFLPILLAYLIMQRHFVESFASTGIKG